MGMYVYAVTRDPCPAGLPVRMIAGSGLVAYVGTVPPDRPPATAVVDAVAAAVPVVPVRPGTVCADDDQVRALLARHAGDVSRLLDHVTGRREWTVRAYGAPGLPHPGTGCVRGRRRNTCVSQVARRCKDPLQGPLQGSAARSLRVRRVSSLEVRAQAVRRAGDIHRALNVLAAAGHRHRHQGPHLRGPGTPMLLDGTYLVDDTRAAAFTALADTLGGNGVELRLTGPRAPYAFATLDLVT